MDIVIDGPLPSSRLENNESMFSVSMANPESNKNNNNNNNNNNDNESNNCNNEVLSRLSELGPTIGPDVATQLLHDDRIRSVLATLDVPDALEAVRKLGDAMVNRPAELDPIADPCGYFLKIMSRYPRGGREGEVVQRLKRLGRNSANIGADLVERILAHDRVRPTLSSLSRADGLEAVDKMAHSLDHRPNNLDPIADPGGYFLKILSRYNPSAGPRKRQRLQPRGGGPDQDSSDDEERSVSDRSDPSLQSQLRLANRRVGRFKTNYWKSERMVAKLQVKVDDLTRELENTKRELNALKGNAR